MGQLADRIAQLLAEHGMDPAARQGDLQSLAALEARDAKLAHERFLEMKRRLLVERRTLLLARLRAFPFVRDAPADDARGYPLREIEADIREAGKALALARGIEDAMADEAAARAGIRHRTLPPAAPLEPRRWDDLRPLAEEAEARRRGARREARVDERAAKLGVDPAALGPADAAHATLDAIERQRAEEAALRDARAAARAPLADPAVREWRRESMRALEREIGGAADAEALRGLTLRAEALRKEAAREAGLAARARKAGARGPERERRAGDAMDGYG